MSTWEDGFTFTFPGASLDDLLLVLLVRDLAFGLNLEVEAEEDGSVYDIHYLSSEYLEDGDCTLHILCEVDGPEDPDFIAACTEQIVEELVDTARSLIDQGQWLEGRAVSDLSFDPVEEGQERFDLVIPCWLEPEEAEWMYSFRAFDGEGGEAWPDDATLEKYGRTLLVPFDDDVHVFAIPATDELIAAYEGAT
jgi:hypothetical protein